MQNIHEHQVKFKEDFDRQGGIAFFLLYFSGRDVFYYLKLDILLGFWKRMLEGGRKSFRYEELDESYIIPHKHGVMVPYLDLINKDLQERD